MQHTKGRTVTPFPELSKPEVKPTAFGEMEQQSKGNFHTFAAFTVSDLPERKATEAERKQGYLTLPTI